MPRIVAAEAIMMMSQKFSWASGHMYFRLRSRTRMRVSLAMVLRWDGGRGWLVWVWGGDGGVFGRRG